MKNQKLLYIFGDPMGAPDSKIGITSHPTVRLGTYQNAYSRNSHIACFNCVYVGPTTAVSRLERAIKDQFSWGIERDGPGATEWISKHTPAMLEKEVDTLIEGYKFKIVKVKSKFLPLTAENMDEFLTAYELN